MRRNFTHSLFVPFDNFFWCHLFILVFGWFFFLLEIFSFYRFFPLFTTLSFYVLLTYLTFSFLNHGLFYFISIISFTIQFISLNLIAFFPPILLKTTEFNALETSFIWVDLHSNIDFNRLHPRASLAQW